MNYTPLPTTKKGFHQEQFPPPVKERSAFLSHRNLSLVLAFLFFTSYFGSRLPMSSRSSASRTDYAYQALPGYFLQSDPATNNHNFDVFNGVPNLGLVSQDWEKLKQEVVQLNQNA